MSLQCVTRNGTGFGLVQEPCISAQNWTRVDKSLQLDDMCLTATSIPLRVDNAEAPFPPFIRDRQIYYAMTTAWDEGLGNVTQAIKAREGMWEKTLLFVVSDNGGPIYAGGAACNFPYRGGKISDFEGGVRVAALVSGGFLPPQQIGVNVTGIMHFADFYTTFCSLSGADPVDHVAAQHNLPPVDGLNMWPMISGQNTTSPRIIVPLSSGRGSHAGSILTPGARGAIINSDYKLIVGVVCEDQWTGPNYPIHLHLTRDLFAAIVNLDASLISDLTHKNPPI